MKEVEVDSRSVSSILLSCPRCQGLGSYLIAVVVVVVNAANHAKIHDATAILVDDHVVDRLFSLSLVNVDSDCFVDGLAEVHSVVVYLTVV